MEESNDRKTEEENDKMTWMFWRKQWNKAEIKDKEDEFKEEKMKKMKKT